MRALEGLVTAVLALPSTSAVAATPEQLAEWRHLKAAHKAPEQAAAAAPPVAGPPNPFTLAYTEDLGKLLDTNLSPTRSLGFAGVDGGVSFRVYEKLIFLDGDISDFDFDGTCEDGSPGPACAGWGPPGSPGFYDLPFFSTDVDLPSGRLPKLTAYPPSPAMQLPLKFLPFWFPNPNEWGHNLGCMNGPIEGVSSASNTWVFFMTGWSWDATTASWLDKPALTIAHTTLDDFAQLRIVHDAAGVPSVFHTQRFNQVSAVADEEGWLWVFGSGSYRQSPVYLARARLDEFALRNEKNDTWRYFDGKEFVPGEANAEKLFIDYDPTRPGWGCVGELSVRVHPQLKLWLATYNCGNQILLRTAQKPTGPWSQPISILDENLTDPPYGSFLHDADWHARFDDGLEIYSQQAQGGYGYGPYQIPSYFHTDAPNVYSIYYAMQTWTPYVPHFMHTVLTMNGAQALAQAARGTGLPKAKLVNADLSKGTKGWATSAYPPLGGGWVIPAPGPAGNTTCTSGGGKGFALTTCPGGYGFRVSQDFTVDATTTYLEFNLSGFLFKAKGATASPDPNKGAPCTVQLIRKDTGDVIRQSWGVWGNVVFDATTNGFITVQVDPPILPIHWRLDMVRGIPLQLLLRNDSDVCALTAWGFRFE